MNKPYVSFFCELGEKEFCALFANTALMHELADLKVKLHIGLHDFGSERTITIKRLKEAGIPVCAWLLLPEEEGYRFHIHNAENAERRYMDFKRCTSENHLKWRGLVWIWSWISMMQSC